MMDLRKFEHFLAVVEEGTVTAAAERLRTAQPALSRQLKRLEADVGLQLFTPQGNRLKLTPSGQALVPIARKFVADGLGVSRAISTLQDGRLQYLTCGALESSIRGFIAPFIATLSPEDPLWVTADLPSGRLERALQEGTDLIVTPLRPDTHLNALQVGAFQLLASVSRTHHWAQEKRTVVTVSELVREQLIIPDHRMASRALIDHTLLTHALSQSPIECPNHLTVLALAASGRGVAVNAEPSHFGEYQLEIHSDTSATPAMTLPLFAAWVPGHYAEEEIQAQAEKLARFIRTYISPPLGICFNTTSA